jgi:hypothetical protein
MIQQILATSLEVVHLRHRRLMRENLKMGTNHHHRLRQQPQGIQQQEWLNWAKHFAK